MGKSYRPGRIGEEIRRIISNMLLREVKDPVLKNSMLSISAVDVTNDGSYATCYVSVLGTGAEGFATDEQKDEIIAAFNRAKGLFKREIGREIKLRHVPELIFRIDNAQEYGQHMSNVIDSLGIENYPERDEETGEVIDSAAAAEDGAAGASGAGSGADAQGAAGDGSSPEIDAMLDDIMKDL